MLRDIEMSESLKLSHYENTKGVIYDHNGNKIIGNFQIPEEFVIGTNELEKELEFPLTVYSSIEGTLIRLFYFKEEWQMSTSSKLDAYESYWSFNKSFGTQFKECVESITGTPIEVFLQSLNKEIKYFFILPTMNINRLGRLPNDIDNNIYLVGIEEQNGKLFYGDKINVEHNLWTLLDKYILNDMSELVSIMKIKNTNLIIYKPDKIVKILSREYKSRFDIRNNQVNLYIRYIELMKTEPKMCKNLIKMYPEINFYEEIEHNLNKIVKYVHTIYIKRYIKHEYVIVPKLYHELLLKLHKDFLINKDKTTLKKVWNLLMTNESEHIYKLIVQFDNCNN